MRFPGSCQVRSWLIQVFALVASRFGRGIVPNPLVETMIASLLRSVIFIMMMQPSAAHRRICAGLGAFWNWLNCGSCQQPSQPKFLDPRKRLARTRAQLYRAILLAWSYHFSAILHNLSYRHKYLHEDSNFQSSISNECRGLTSPAENSNTLLNTPHHMHYLG
jgi:hypothetical protein